MSHINKYCVSTQIKTKLLLPLGSGQSLGFEADSDHLERRCSENSWTAEFSQSVKGLIGAHTKEYYLAEVLKDNCVLRLIKKFQ